VTNINRNLRAVRAEFDSFEIHWAYLGVQCKGLLEISHSPFGVGNSRERLFVLLFGVTVSVAQKGMK
jgi:hypothetical protein